MGATRLLVLCIMATVGVAGIEGCGEDFPADAAIKIGDTVISKADVDHYLAVQMRARGKQLRAWGPPRYPACVAAKRTLPRGRSLTLRSLRRHCRIELDFERAQAAQRLLRAEWYEREAERRGIELTDAEIKRIAARRREQFSLGTDAYQRALERSGQSEADALFDIRVALLNQKLLDDTAVSGRTIAAYYARHTDEFVVPEERHVRRILTRTRQAALDAKRALRGGARWERMFRYSVDQTAEEPDGTLEIAQGHANDREFARAAFEAAPGRLTGPLRTAYGWYVFEVKAVEPGIKRSLRAVHEELQQSLRVRALDRELRARYSAETKCAAEYERLDNLPECRGGAAHVTPDVTTPLR
jgi:foldase protein PrsA